MPAACQASACAGELAAKPMVPPLAGGRLAVDRLRDREDAGRRHVEDAVAVDRRRRDTERAQHLVIERLGPVQVVGPDHDMRKHRAFLRPAFPERTPYHGGCAVVSRFGAGVIAGRRGL